MKRREVSLYYCNACKATTRHAENVTHSTCLRCGTVKNITRIKKSTSPEHQSQQTDTEWN